MKSLLVILAIPVFLVKYLKAETGLENRESNCGGSVLDNILRLERAVTKLSGELKTTQAALDSTEHKLEERIDEIANLTKKKGSDQGVSFQVRLIKRPYTPGQFEPLKFDDVTLNKGGGYNPTSGIFTVPRTGTYLCWANIMTHTNNHFRVRLMEEGKDIVRGYTGNQAYGTAVITYLKTFKKGEHVWFDVYVGTLSIAGEKYSSYGCNLMYL